MPFIEECLKSVMAQGSYVASHIVMDGASSDGTQDVLRDYEKKYCLAWRSEADQGQAHALSKALEQVSTEYFLWLNADDVLMPDALCRLSSVLEQSQACSIIYGDYSKIDASGRMLAYRKQPTFHYWDCLYGYLTVHNGAALFSTSAVRAAGGFDIALKFAMDYDLVLKTARCGGVCYVPIHICGFRLHPAAKTSRILDVCRAETLLIRSRVSGKTGLSLRWRETLSKVRVAIRMLKEGCIPCRLSRMWQM